MKIQQVNLDEFAQDIAGQIAKHGLEMKFQALPADDHWKWLLLKALADHLIDADRPLPESCKQVLRMKEPRKDKGSTYARNIALALKVGGKVTQEVAATRNDETSSVSACDIVARGENLSYVTVKKAWLKNKQLVDIFYTYNPYP